MRDYEEDTTQEPDREDQRVVLMRRVVMAEEQTKHAQATAKEAASRANKLSTELANMRIELYRALGVEEPRHPGEREV